MIAVLVLSCVACGGGITKEQIVGTWGVTEAKGDSDVKLLLSSQITFKSDGTYDWSYMGTTFMSGTYSVSGSHLSLDEAGMQIKINGKIMTLKDGSGELTLVKR